MTTRTTSTIAFLITAAVALAAGGTPEGWMHLGNDPGGYEMTTDPTGGIDGGPAAMIKSLKPQKGKFGTLMQTFQADEYRGKRVRLTAKVRTEGVKKSAGMWMRIDGEQGMLQFDNTRDRRLKGTTDWTEQVIVLDVPDFATTVNFGLILMEKGTAWMDKLDFEVVDRSVASTNTYQAKARGPANLNFAN